VVVAGVMSVGFFTCPMAMLPAMAKIMMMAATLRF
jgi:hypothetical protein